jgi:hypothetical protein
VIGHLYFDLDLNAVLLNVRATVLYSRGDGQTFDVPYWLLTPSTYASLFRQVADSDHAWYDGKMGDAVHQAMCERWEAIDAYARANLDAAAIDDAMKRQARIGRPLPLPKPPHPNDASSPWGSEAKR